MKKCKHNDQCTKKQRINDSIELILNYGGDHDAQHKQWVLDQVLRTLAGPKYDNLIKEHNYPKDDDVKYEWDCGVAP